MLRKGYKQPTEERHTAQRATAPQLTAVDASRIKGMLRRKDRQSDISQYHSVNQGRIVEIRQGKIFPHVAPMPANLLPPPGPYTVVTRISHERVLEVREELRKVFDKLSAALDSMEGESGDGERRTV